MTVSVADVELDSDVGGVGIFVETGVASRLAVGIGVADDGCFVAMGNGVFVNTEKFAAAVSSRPNPVVYSIPIAATAATATIATKAMATGTAGKLRLKMGSTSNWRRAIPPSLAMGNCSRPGVPAKFLYGRKDSVIS